MGAIRSIQQVSAAADKLANPREGDWARKSWGKENPAGEMQPRGFLRG